MKSAVFVGLAFLMLASSFTASINASSTGEISSRGSDGIATLRGLGATPLALSPSHPWVGLKINVFLNAPSVQYFNSSDYLYVVQGWADENWSRLTQQEQSAFLDPQQNNFTLQTTAPNFNSPNLNQWTNYDSATDSMASLFWYQFFPGDLAPGNYSFTGTWSTNGAGYPPDNESFYYQNTITAVIDQANHPTTLLVSCTPNLVSAGELTTCTATISGLNPTGTVTWSTSSPGGSFIHSVCTLTDGNCSTAYVDNFTGSVTIAAYYSGDSNNAPSSGCTTIIVTAGGPIYYSLNYTSVQATIDAAPVGATVIVSPGFYTESLTVNKRIIIVGDRDPPVFSGGASGVFLTLSGASGSIVTGIEISNYAKGILATDSSNCRIYNNIMTSIGDSGIVFEGYNATNNAIFNNIFQDVPTPINLTTSASNNRVYDNIVSSQLAVSVDIGANRNSVYGNTISGSNVLMNLRNSEDNIIYHNNFIATSQITVLTTGNNVWANGYPSGGNYWSNYTGTDQMKGPGQNQAGSDGIGDTPYIINSNSKDDYPLMKPWTATAGHCVGVASVVSAKTVVGQGFSVNITAGIIDRGEFTESFTVAAYANGTGIGAQQVNNLNSMCQSTVSFRWNTTGFSKGNYTIWACAGPVSYQTDMSQSNFTLGIIHVTIPGDVNGDFKVTLTDLVILASAYQSRLTDTKWNPNADINSNGVVDLADLVIMALHYGQRYS